jgi:hypothetical protein
MNIKTLIKDNTVEFLKLRKGFAYYRISNPEEHGRCYSFPVPIEDLGDATLLARDRAMLFMRYIRQAIHDRSLVPENV